MQMIPRICADYVQRTISHACRPVSRTAWRADLQKAVVRDGAACRAPPPTSQDRRFTLASSGFSGRLEYSVLDGPGPFKSSSPHDLGSRYELEIRPDRPKVQRAHQSTRPAEKHRQRDWPSRDLPAKAAMHRHAGNGRFKAKTESVDHRLLRVSVSVGETVLVFDRAPLAVATCAFYVLRPCPTGRSSRAAGSVHLQSCSTNVGGSWRNERTESHIMLFRSGQARLAAILGKRLQWSGIT